MGIRLFEELIGRATAGMPGWIDAATVAGSHARGDQDRHSDLDLFFLLAPQTTVSVSEAAERLIEWAGPALLSRGPVFIPHFGYSITLVLDGLAVCQFNLNTRETLELNPMRSTSRILFDHSGHLTSLVEAAKSLRADEAAIYQEQQHYFWIRALFAWRAVQRGELWRAVDYLADMRRAMQQIMRIQHGRYDAVKSPHHPAKRFEDIMGDDLARTLQMSQPVYSREQILAGLQESANWFFEMTYDASELEQDVTGWGCAAQIQALIGSDG